jgi:hypothetical protein
LQQVSSLIRGCREVSNVHNHNDKVAEVRSGTFGPRKAHDKPVPTETKPLKHFFAHPDLAPLPQRLHIIAYKSHGSAGRCVSTCMSPDKVAIVPCAGIQTHVAPENQL